MGSKWITGQINKNGTILFKMFVFGVSRQINPLVFFHDKNINQILT